jgi:hypothetical protein
VELLPISGGLVRHLQNELSLLAKFAFCLDETFNQISLKSETRRIRHLSNKISVLKTDV